MTLLKLALANKNDPGMYIATNVVSNHEVCITQDMLGDWYGSVQVIDSDGYYGEGDESDCYNTIEEAANWCECQKIIMTTNFDGSPMIEETV